MASYTTKFSINDTAYLVDATSLNIVPAIISTIYLNHAVGNANPVIAYGVTFSNSSLVIRQTKYAESDLMYLEEAKAKAVELLNQRTAEIESLR